MSHRYFSVLNCLERQNGSNRPTPQRFSPQKSSSKPSNFPRNSSEDNFVDFVPLDYSSPVQVRGRGGQWRLNTTIGHNASFNPYNSNRTPKFGSHNRSFSYNKSQKYSPQNRGGQHNSNNRGSNPWFDPSMVEDPWAELEKKQQVSSSESTSDLSFISCNSNPSQRESSTSSGSSFYQSTIERQSQSRKSGIDELSPSLSEKAIEICSPAAVVALT